MSKPANPLELVDRYLQAVRFWLPKTQRQEEILAELGEDLRSQVDAREEELGRPANADEVAEILKRCGPPMVVAARLGPNNHLIGPTLFPIYWFVLKMVLFWIMIPVFVFIVGPVNVVNSGGNWGTAIASTIGNLWSGWFIAAGTITLVFAVLERAHAHAGIECKWDPLKLPPIKKQEKKPSLAHTVCELAFNVFGLIWILLLPQYPWLLFGPAKNILSAGPIWHVFYVPVVLIAVFALLRSTITLARPQWEWFPPTAQLLQTIISMVILRYMLAAAGVTAAGAWHPFVVVSENVRNSAQYAHVAAIVNVSVLIGLTASWLGFSIAVVVQTWQVLRYLDKRVSSAAEAALLLR